MGLIWARGTTGENFLFINIKLFDTDDFQILI